VENENNSLNFSTEILSCIDFSENEQLQLKAGHETVLLLSQIDT
jgi:serine phosphatase RsbU (regulator of sigma subunit)